MEAEIGVKIEQAEIVRGSKTFRNQNKLTMSVGEKWRTSVLCMKKKEGMEKAAQKILMMIHPTLTKWGSVLKMYGSMAQNAQKTKKEKESEVRRKTIPNS